jgi:type IV pilus assembly protein PilW
MVAIAVGLLLMGGAISIFVSNKRTYEVTEELSRLQENARYALQIMLDEIRMAGYAGCGTDLSRVTSTIVAAPGSLLAFGVNGGGLEGIDGVADVSTWSPSGAALGFAASRITTVQDNTGADAITLRYAGGIGRRVLANTTKDTVQVEAPATVAAGQPAALLDCGAGTTFIVDELDTAGTVATITAAVAFPQEFETSGTQFFPRVSSLRAVRYFIGTGDAGGNSRSLRRVTVAGGDEELVEGIEQMQILYGVDVTGDGQPDSYVAAGSANLSNALQWSQVVSVRLGLLMRTVTESGAQVDTRAYDLFTGQSFANLGACGGGPGCVDPPDLRVRHRVFSTTVFLRNRTS